MCVTVADDAVETAGGAALTDAGAYIARSGSELYTYSPLWPHCSSSLSPRSLLPSALCHWPQVASIPIAIEIVCTTTLALGSRQLSAYGAIVTRLQAIEEMAGMNMLCSDKTGECVLMLHLVCAHATLLSSNWARLVSSVFPGQGGRAAQPRSMLSPCCLLPRRRVPPSCVWTPLPAWPPLAGTLAHLNKIDIQG